MEEIVAKEHRLPTVLIVEDEQPLLNVISDKLLTRGFDVLSSR